MPQAPPRPTAVRPESNGNGIAAKSARIDLDAGDEEPAEGSWEMRNNYQDAPEGDLDWVVRGKEDDLDNAAGVLESAAEKARAATHGELNTSMCRQCSAIKSM